MKTGLRMVTGRPLLILLPRAGLGFVNIGSLRLADMVMVAAATDEAQEDQKTGWTCM